VNKTSTPEENEEPKSSKYHNVFGSIGSIGVIQQGDNTIANVNMNSTVTVDPKYLEAMAKQYAESLLNFTSRLNIELQKENVQTQAVANIQTQINELAQETPKLAEKTVDDNRKSSIKEKLKAVIVAVAKASPKIAKTILTFTPLAPFSELVGETIESLVQKTPP
jgi:hypothetical protein